MMYSKFSSLSFFSRGCPHHAVSDFFYRHFVISPISRKSLDSSRSMTFLFQWIFKWTWQDSFILGGLAFFCLVTVIPFDEMEPFVMVPLSVSTCWPSLKELSKLNYSRSNNFAFIFVLFFCLQSSGWNGSNLRNQAVHSTDEWDHPCVPLLNRCRSQTINLLVQKRRQGARRPKVPGEEREIQNRALHQWRHNSNITFC